jgi:hypothetical protein
MAYKHTPSLRTIAENADAELLTGCYTTLNTALDGLQTQPARTAVIRALQNINSARKNIGPR